MLLKMYETRRKKKKRADFITPPFIVLAGVLSFYSIMQSTKSRKR